MLTPDLETLLMQVPFAQASSARARLLDLAGEPAEMLALARVSTELSDALLSCSDADRALNNLERFVHARGSRMQLYHLFAQHPAALDALVRIVAASQYLADVLVRNPEYFDLLTDTALLQTPRNVNHLASELGATTGVFRSTESKLNAVRRFHRRELLRIGAADLLGYFDLVTTTAQLSKLADAVVRECLCIVAGNGNNCDLMALAFGKLGGGELNYSSDLDLVFIARTQKHVTAAIELARELTSALGAYSDEGFLYRVDLRLRPYGAAGALVVSRDSFVDYIETKADPAERQALLKARAITGDAAAGERMLQRLAICIFADGDSARQRVRDLKGRIERQLNSSGKSQGHVKLAPGGIRDIEFITQALQLEHGSAQPTLRTGNTLDALAALTRIGALAVNDARSLRDAYVFLRTVEHRMQLMNNQQVHQLPNNDRALLALARLLCFNEVGQFREAYDTRVREVREIFDRLLA